MPGSIWDLPGTGIKLCPHALAGGFLTTEPPVKPHSLLLLLLLQLLAIQINITVTKDERKIKEKLNEMVVLELRDDYVEINI